MAHIAQDSLATIYFEFTWKSSNATHVERYLAEGVSFTRDILPLGVKSRMRGLGVGDSVEMAMDPSEVPAFKPGKILDMPRTRFKAQVHGRDIKPRIGRYYPKFYIESVPGTRPDSATPFRVVKADRAGFKADLNHPMAGREVTLKATVVDVRPPSEDAGNLSRWSEIILKGPGMQARLLDTPTDFLGADPFLREDETDDAAFYSTEKAADHLEASSIESVQKVYGALLENGMDILDLMPGRTSRLPEDITPASVIGLGLSQEGMDGNADLDKNVIHNLNDDPKLPFDDASFDAVICTASVGYLTKPFEVFEDVARVLKPGGVFAVTYTNHWFEPKVIQVWTELQEFERMGLVSQFFIRTEQYEDLWTSSDRVESGAKEDSVFAVWGRKI